MGASTPRRPAPWMNPVPDNLPAIAEGGGRVVETPFPMTNSALTAALKKAEEVGEAKQKRQSTRELKLALEAADVAHLGEIERLKERAIDGEKAAHAHGFHKAAWMVGLPAFCAGVAATLLVMLVVVRANTEATTQGVAVGSMVRAQQDIDRERAARERGDWIEVPGLPGREAD